MADPAVVNASPLILLTAAGLTELLHLAGNPVLVPRAVIEEIEAYGPSDATATAVRQANWLTIVEPNRCRHHRTLGSGVGRIVGLDVGTRAFGVCRSLGRPCSKTLCRLAGDSHSRHAGLGLDCQTTGCDSRG